MFVELASTTSKIPLERSATIRRHLPLASDVGWVLPDFYVGSENAPLRYLFDDNNIRQLAQLSPIVFYGDKEVGKTALSITLAVSWSRLSGLRPLSFSTGQSFSDDYSAAVEIDDVDSFRSRHRQCQLLVIDNLEQMVRAQASQQELVTTLDVLAEAGRPVIVSVSRLPSTIRGIHSALASRLSGGFSVAIHKPTADTLNQLVPAVVKAIDAKLPVDEVITVCTRFTAMSLSVADIHKIVTIASQNKLPSGCVDWPVVSLLANQLFIGEGPTLAGIAKVVARKMHVRLLEMRGATRQANIVRARGLAIYLARKLTPSSLNQIGEFFAGRDHSTVIHACRKTEKLLDVDTELANLLQEVQAEVLGK